MREINANQISLFLKEDKTLEIYVDNEIVAEISDGRLEHDFAVEVLEGLDYVVKGINFEMRALLASERNYVYSQSQQISMQTGFIGHLRADMDLTEKSFLSSWDTFRKDLKTQEFKDEFDEVINELRKGRNFLHNRAALSKYCHSHMDTFFGNSREFGVRVNTDNYAYMMRLIPSDGEHNLYCFCYRKDWLDQHLEKAQRGIRFIDSHYNELFKIRDGDKIVITLSDGEKIERTCRYIDDYHLEVGNNLFHICEFAERMEQNGSKYAPTDVGEGANMRKTARTKDHER